MKAYNVGAPLERIAIDITGPLPKTDAGNRYVLVVADYFTKWTEAYSIPDQEAGTVAKKLVEEFVARYGVPREIHSDQGRNFESALFQEVCRLLDLDKTRTTPLRPMEWLSGSTAPSSLCCPCSYTRTSGTGTATCLSCSWRIARAPVRSRPPQTGE